MIASMSGSHFFTQICSSNGIETNISATFNKCFFHLPVIIRGIQTMWQFEGHKWTFLKKCPIAASTTAGGGVNIKLPRQKVSDYHLLGVKWIINSSLDHHDLIQLRSPPLLSTTDLYSGKNDNIFSPIKTSSVGQLLDKVSIPHSFILSPGKINVRWSHLGFEAS